MNPTERLARIIDPLAWEILDAEGADKAQFLGITTDSSLERARAVIAVQEEHIRETYSDLCDLHVFLQGFNAEEAGALASSYPTLVERVRGNALALEGWITGVPIPTEAALALQGVLPMAQWAMEMARAAGEGDDWGAAWESIYPTMDWAVGEGMLAEDQEDAPEIERAKSVLFGAGLEL
ncbi:hypothetical protein BAMBUS_01150 [Brevundimonas phage vB_BpoS-Bambus]|nr:hypothetical protein BAMBUS_01150 [Brevundimonas phage vB_BpoS-Bambus]